ncbi:MAG TPA: energy transducer TonB [Longimicrobiales bacterium]|nr:energy transducer TonB [Longimicrobiales bacterium]
MTRHSSSIAPLAATVLLLAACSEAPTAPVVPEAAPTPPTEAAVAAEANTGDEKPRFIPYDTPPRLQNAQDVRRALQELYPSELKEAGVGGVVNVWLYIDETGAVQEARVSRSSGAEGLDAAALELAQIMNFESAKHRDRPVAVWVQIPVTFAVGR